MAVGGSNLRRLAEHSRTYDSLRRHRQKEMGDQFRLYVDLRICVGPRRLGPVRLQHGVRTAMVPIPGHAEFGNIGGIHDRPSNDPGGRIGHAGAHLPDGDADLLPIRVRGHHCHHPCRLRARPHELHRVDDLLPGVDDAGLHRGRVQPVGRRLARQHGRGRLLRRLRHPSCRRHVGLRRGLGDRPAAASRPRSFPAQ